jgi:hypothetical protein
VRSIYTPVTPPSEHHLVCDLCGYETVVYAARGHQFVGDARVQRVSNAHDRDCPEQQPPKQLLHYPWRNAPKDGDDDE